MMKIAELIFGDIRSYSNRGHIQKEYQHHGFVFLTVFLLSPLEQRLNSISSDHCKMVPPVVVAGNVGANPIHSNFTDLDCPGRYIELVLFSWFITPITRTYGRYIISIANGC